MNRLDVVRALLHNEVVEVEEGTDHLLFMVERRRERVREAKQLRRFIDQCHPSLPAAVERRREVM